MDLVKRRPVWVGKDLLPGQALFSLEPIEEPRVAADEGHGESYDVGEPVHAGQRTGVKDEMRHEDREKYGAQDGHGPRRVHELDELDEDRRVRRRGHRVRRGQSRRVRRHHHCAWRVVLQIFFCGLYLERGTTAA
eukprot:4915419-Prymnesium_polylepis.1